MLIVKNLCISSIFGVLKLIYSKIYSSLQNQIKTTYLNQIYQKPKIEDQPQIYPKF